MSLYFWLGAEAGAPLADENARYDVEDHADGFTASLIEDDGFITVRPDLLEMQIRQHIPITVTKTPHGRSVRIGGRKETLFITDAAPVCPRQIAINLTR